VVSPPRLVVQIVTTNWRKSARGGPLATFRNAVPERLPLPAVPREEGVACLLHQAEYDERDRFARPAREWLKQPTSLPLVLHGCVGIYLQDGILRIAFEGPYALDTGPGILAGYERLGAPGRTMPHEPFTLRAGKWGQIRHMGRFSAGSDGYTFYQKRVYNIGWLAEVTAAVLTASRPGHQFVSLPNVW